MIEFRRILVSILAAMVLAGCGAGDSFQLTTDPVGTKIVTGRFSPSLLESDSSFVWYPHEFKSFNPDSSSVAPISTHAANLHFIVVGGTWCSDTRRELPRFFKTLAVAHVDGEKVELYGVDRSKVSQDGLTERYNINRVPTFIVFLQGQEVGRIVEFSKPGIDIELANILREK